MLGKGHCRFDPHGRNSEFADFYDFSEPENDGDEEEEADGTCAKTGGNPRERPVQPDDSSLRLSSGRIISHRPALRKRSRDGPRAASAHLPLDDAAASNPTASPPTASPAAELSWGAGSGERSQAVARREKRENKMTMRLANLKESDRQSIARLPLAQQRAVVATQQRQTDEAKRAERRYQSRVEGLGNKTKMKHFVIDADDGRLLRALR